MRALRDPAAAAPPGSPADLKRLRGYLLANIVGLLSAVLSLPVLGLAIVDAPQLWADWGFLTASFLILVAGWPALRRGRGDLAVLAIIGANWIAALGTTLVSPFLLPINELAVLLPVMVMFQFLPTRTLRPTIAVTVLMVAAIAGIGELRPNFSTWASEPPGWLPSAVVISFVPVLSAIIALGIWQNYARLLEQASQLQASRARVVAAADDARRRIERDLHDGAQQRLVTMSVRLGLLTRFLDTDPKRAAATVAELSTELHEAIGELRELAHGIYPPLLAERGLSTVLATAVRRLPLRATLDAPGLRRYPADIEAAVYFCCLEALQNAVKHAGASTVVVTVTDQPRLRFAVADDGRGFEPALAGAGSGLTSMADRIGAVGGMLRVEAATGRGTVIHGELPT